MRFTTAFLAVFLAFAVSAAPGAVQSQQAADALSKKIAAITQRGNETRKSGVPSSVTLTEDELNSWFLFRSTRYLPAGVSKPSVALIGGGSMRGTATLDLEAVARKRTNPLDPLSYLFGRVPVTVTGTLRARDGMGRFDVQSTEVAGISVPKPILQELLSLYATSAEQPEGIRLDDPFALPANIQRIDVAPGQMVVVQ